MRLLLLLTLAATATAAQAQQTFSAEELRHARERITYELRDPSSAQFRETFAYRLPNGNVVVCGQINAKNAIGAYVGFTRFLTVGQSALIASSDPLRGAQFENAYRQLCVSKPEAVAVRL